MTNTCKYCGGLIDQSASFCDSRCKDLFSKYTPICKQCAAKDAENEELKNWKESASDILRTIDLQECSKFLKLSPGSEIAKYILPAIKSLSEKDAEIERLNKLLNDGFEDAYQAGFNDGSDCYKK